MPANIEHDALISSYEHLPSMPRADDALHTIRKIASLVKPIMRKRNWRVKTLSEFYPDQQNLLGINVNKGYKICLRLRYPSDKSLFLPVDQVVDTMLHELSHNVFGPHDEKFHNLWEELRDEYAELTIKGYTGENFLSEGRRLGGNRYVPIQEMRRQARAAAEQRKVRTQGSGQKLGGALIPWGMDIRQVIADAAQSRMAITKGCASERQDAVAIGEEASQNGFRTKAEEDDANDRAIAQALWELVQEQEARKAGVTDWRSDGLTWNPGEGLQPAFHPGDPPMKPRKSKNANGKSKAAAVKAPAKVTPAKSALTPTTRSKPLSKSEAEAETKSRQTKSSEDRQHQPTSPQPPRKKPKTVADILPDIKRTNSEPADISNTTPPPALPSNWSCNLCTLVNPITNTTCAACDSKRPASITALLAPPKQKPKLERPTRSNSTSSNNARLLSLTKSSALISAEEAAARERIKPKSGWTCSRCGEWSEAMFWSCSRCGNIKEKS